MAQYRKKPVVIDAIQWNGGNLTELASLGGAREYEQDFMSDSIVIHTLEGDMTTANKGDWIIKGISSKQGIHFWPVKPDYFEENYEKV